MTVAAAAAELAAAGAEFDLEPGLVYLDAATYGLPPRATMAALARALERWQRGTADFIAEWDAEGEVCRALFAAIIGAAEEQVALVPTVSVTVGQVAASLPRGAEVVVPDDEFTSVLLPFLAAAEARGIRVRRVPFADLAAAVRPGTYLVAFSLTRSQDGRTADLGEIAAAAERVGARLLVDATHAVPFVPMGAHLEAIDYLICHGYKHLLCPRGVGFFVVRRDRWPELPAWFANWRSASPRYERNYGGTLTLPPTAARYDVSLAWHAWVGARPSLEAIWHWRQSGALEAARELAVCLARKLGAPTPAAAIVALETPDAEAVAAALDVAGVRCAARGGRVRCSTHVWNTAEEIDRAAAVIGGVMDAR